MAQTFDEEEWLEATRNKRDARDFMFVNFGKYEGKTYREVEWKDPQYCKWLVDNTRLNSEDAVMMRRYLLRRDAGWQRLLENRTGTRLPRKYRDRDDLHNDSTSAPTTTTTRTSRSSSSGIHITVNFANAMVMFVRAVATTLATMTRMVAMGL